MLQNMLRGTEKLSFVHQSYMIGNNLYIYYLTILYTPCFLSPHEAFWLLAIQLCERKSSAITIIRKITTKMSDCVLLHILNYL